MAERVGEVIESSSTRFVAQCYSLHQPPSLGSLVTVRDGQTDILAIVCDASTVSIHPGRRPVARGMEEATEEELYARNPQLEQLLRTLFSAQIVGHTVGDGSLDTGSGEKVRQHLPAHPPKIHAFVYACDQEEMACFSHSLDFLKILVDAAAPAGDELITACLRLLSTSSQEPRQYLVRAGKELLAGEPQRLNAVLRGLRP